MTFCLAFVQNYAGSFLLFLRWSDVPCMTSGILTLLIDSWCILLQYSGSKHLYCISDGLEFAAMTKNLYMYCTSIPLCIIHLCIKSPWCCHRTQRTLLAQKYPVMCEYISNRAVVNLYTSSHLFFTFHGYPWSLLLPPWWIPSCFVKS